MQAESPSMQAGKACFGISEAIVMKLRAILIAISLAGFAGVAAAGEAHQAGQPAEAIQLLSRATGLTVDEVELALGPSADYEHPARHACVVRRFRQAVGRTMYEQIMGDGKLSATQVQNLVAMARARQPKLAKAK
jgi:hypothetical protein